MPTLDDLRKQSQSNIATGSKLNLMIYGDIGSGKTRALKTAQMPMLLDNFEPGGEFTLSDEIAKGDIIVSDYSNEDAKHPSAYDRWTKDFEQKKRDGLFDQVGTYAIDSASTWSDAIMNAIMKKEGRAGLVPQLQDYNLQQIFMRDHFKLVMALPCDVIFTCHLELDKDETTGKMVIKPLIGGKKGKAKMLLLFSEIYYLSTIEKKDSIERRFLTARTGLYMARTRIGREGKFDLYEPADVMALKRKAGLA